MRNRRFFKSKTKKKKFQVTIFGTPQFRSLHNNQILCANINNIKLFICEYLLMFFIYENKKKKKLEECRMPHVGKMYKKNI